MKTLHFLPTLLLALSLAATAQTTPVPQQTTTVTEDLDPATGKVIRRTTRTTTEPVTTTATPTTATPAPAVDAAPATDAVVSAFLNKKTTVSTLSAAELPTAYERLLNKVHNERQGWQPAQWATAVAVLSALNVRYEQLRPTLSLDDKVSIRTQQVEFQAVRLGHQVSKQVSDKL